MNEKLESDSFIIKFILFLIGLLAWSIPIGITGASWLLKINLEFSNNCLFPLSLIMYFILILTAMNGWDVDFSNYGKIIGKIFKFVLVSLCALVGITTLIGIKEMGIGGGIGVVVFLAGFILVCYWTARGALRLYYEPPELFHLIKEKISK